MKSLELFGMSISSFEVRWFPIWSWRHLNIRPSSNSIMNDTGPTGSIMCPGIHHCSPAAKFRTNTDWPTENEQLWAVVSIIFCCSCLACTLSAIFWIRASILERGLSWSESSAGAIPVVLCGVILYWKKILTMRASKVPSVTFFKPFFRLCTARSTNPFKDGWYRDDLVWQMAFNSKYDWNSWLVKYAALSETTVL